MDLNVTEFQKLGPNVTGFQLVNQSDLAVEKINQDWLEFDSKDLKLARRRLRVQTHTQTCAAIFVRPLHLHLFSDTCVVLTLKYPCFH